MVAGSSLKNFTGFEVLEVTFLYHGKDGIVDSALVVESHAHLMLQLLEGDLRANRDSSLDCFLDLFGHFLELDRRLTLRTGQATLRGIHCRDLEDAMGLLDVSGSDNRLQVDLGNGLRDTDDSFKLAHSDGDARSLLVETLVLRLGTILDVKILKHVAGLFSELRRYLHPSVADVLTELLQRDLALDLTVGFVGVHVKADDVRSDGFIGVDITNIPDNEDRVEAGQNRSLEVDLLGRMLQVVVSALKRVGGGQDRGTRVEDRCDASLGDRDGLLLHCLVDGNTVLRPHLVELIDADNSTIGEDHGTALELEFSSRVIFDH